MEIRIPAKARTTSGTCFILSIPPPFQACAYAGMLYILFGSKTLIHIQITRESIHLSGVLGQGSLKGSKRATSPHFYFESGNLVFSKTKFKPIHIPISDPEAAQSSSTQSHNRLRRSQRLKWLINRYQTGCGMKPPRSTSVGMGSGGSGRSSGHANHNCSSFPLLVCKGLLFMITRYHWKL